MSTIMKLENVVKKFYVGQPNELLILNNINLEVQEGEFISIVGPSRKWKININEFNGNFR